VRPATVIVEFVASVAAIAWALEFDRRVGQVGADQTLRFLLHVLAILVQYRAVVGPTGYGGTLAGAEGATPTVSLAVLALSLALVTLGRLAFPRVRGWRLQRRGYAATSFWLMTYVLPISTFEAQSHDRRRALRLSHAPVRLGRCLADRRRGRRPDQHRDRAATVRGRAGGDRRRAHDRHRAGGPLSAALQSQWPSPSGKPFWLGARRQSWPRAASSDAWRRLHRRLGPVPVSTTRLSPRSMAAQPQWRLPRKHLRVAAGGPRARVDPGRRRRDQPNTAGVAPHLRARVDRQGTRPQGLVGPLVATGVELAQLMPNGAHRERGPLSRRRGAASP